MKRVYVSGENGTPIALPPGFERCDGLGAADYWLLGPADAGRHTHEELEAFPDLMVARCVEHLELFEQARAFKDFTRK